MKKLFLFLLAFISLSASAQIYQAQNGYGFQYKRLKIDSTLHIPTFCGVPTLRNSVIGNQSAIAFDSCNNILYKYDPKYETWSPISNGSGIIQDGLISGGIVTWSGIGLKFYITSAQYILGGKFYSSPLDSVTLNTADTQSRVDLFIVDTTSHAGKITGVADGNLLTPQVDPASQIALTTGIQINPGDTIPPNVITNTVYDENLGTPYEWNPTKYEGAFTVDFNSLSRPEKGVKSIYISSYNGAVVYFTGAYQDLSSDQNLSFWVYLNGKFSNNMYALLANSSTGAQTNYLPVQGLNKEDSSHWQHIVIPTSYFTWYKPATNFNRLYLKLSGVDTTKGLYIDNISLQKGINSIPPQTDYSNKLDSVTVQKITVGSDTANVVTTWVKGASYPRKDTIWTNAGTTGSVSWGDITGSLPDQTDLLDSLNNKVNKTDRFPINVVKPIRAIDSVTIGVDSVYLRDTSLNLGGGTTNQVLKKNSSTNGDWSWQDESGGGITGNYIDTTTAPTDSTIRFHFVQGNYVDYIIRAPQIDTSHLSDRINANAANIAANTASITTNTANIAANTSAIAGKQDAITLTTTGTSGAATLTGSTLNIPNYATGGGGGSGGVVDTTGTLNTIHNNKGFLFSDSTLSGNHNSPDVVQSGRNNGKKTWWGTYIDGGITNGSWNLFYSSDSGATKHVLLNVLYNGTWAMTGTLAVSSYVTATQFAAGTKFNVVGSTGQMQLGGNVINPRATLIHEDTTKGFITNRGATTAARRITSNIYTATITNGGTGYTNVSNATRTFTAISGYAPDFTTSVTISGGVLTTFSTGNVAAYGARNGDTYTCSNCGAGSGMIVTVSALTGDTARGLQYYDSSLNQMLVWNGQAYSHEVDYLTNTTYSLLHGPDYIFTGTSAATWTLPAVSTSHVGDGNTISIMNMGTVSITLNSFSGSKIIPTGSITPQASLTIASGSTVKLFPTGTAFKVLYNN